MILIDSSGWLEYFTAGPNANRFEKIIVAHATELVVPTIVLYEIFKKILLDKDEEHALQTIGQLKKFRIIPMDEDLSLSAAKISKEYKLPMADSYIYATAKKFKATIWTQDEDFIGLENVVYIEKKAKG